MGMKCYGINRAAAKAGCALDCDKVIVAQLLWSWLIFGSTSGSLHRRAPGRAPGNRPVVGELPVEQRRYENCAREKAAAIHDSNSNSPYRTAANRELISSGLVPPRLPIRLEVIHFDGKALPADMGSLHVVRSTLADFSFVIWPNFFEPRLRGTCDTTWPVHARAKE